MGESFPPIVGYKAHGAIVHLNVSEEDALPLKREGVLLIDSGGQYLHGTTDITRTVALGDVTKMQKTDYTLVLKGMIALTTAQFPEGTKGCNLDILARKALWERGLNYGHGTGHGVGHFLNVHEGPVSIRQECSETPVLPGMVLSNEPGIYREGEYGIRIENLLVCVEKRQPDLGDFSVLKRSHFVLLIQNLLILNCFQKRSAPGLTVTTSGCDKSLSPWCGMNCRIFWKN